MLTCKGRKLRPSEDHVMFCSESPVMHEGGNGSIQLQLLYLRQRKDPSAPSAAADEKTVFQTRSLELASRTDP